MTIAFLYRWTELSTGKWYEGSRSRKGCHPDDGYICSSKEVFALITENPTGWERELLVIGEPGYIRPLETTRLKSLDARNDPMSYNKHNADGSVDHITGRKRMTDGRISKFVFPHDVDRFIAAGWRLGCSDSHKKNNSKSHKGKTPPNKGVAMSEEQKQSLRKPKKAGSGAKLSASRKALFKAGKLVPHNKGKPSPMRGKKTGRVPTDETRALWSQQRKGKTPVNKGVPTPKTVSRLKDKKEMSLAHFTQWCNRQDNNKEKENEFSV